MGLRVIYVMTHDSIGLGEDGPTHQPVEHVASLRAMPNVNVFRPADAVETARMLGPWRSRSEGYALGAGPDPAGNSRPFAMSTRKRTSVAARRLCAARSRRARARATILATGSEVEIAHELPASALQADGVPTAVVSMPCWELFDAQDAAYRAQTLGDGVRVSIEAGVTFGWARYGVDEANIVGMPGFGASAPAPEVYKHFGITAEAVVERVKSTIG